jgi:hypothetical protein
MMQANLSWQGGDGAASKTVEKKINTGAYGPEANLPGTATSYEDIDLVAVPGDVVTYRVTATNPGGSVSVEASAVVPPTAFDSLNILLVQ